MSLLAEAIRSSVLPCSFALLVPGIVVLGLSKGPERIPSAAFFWAGAFLFAWMPFLDVPLGIDTRLGGAGAIGLGGWLMLRGRLRTARLGGAGVVGAFAGATWIPCVGSEFGAILTTGVADPASALAPMALYVLGALAPAVVVLALVEFVPAIRSAADGVMAQRAALTMVSGLGVVVLVGAYPRLLSELARISTL